MPKTKPARKRTPKFHRSRAERAEVALRAYNKNLGEDARPDSETVRDLAQDILHWLARRGNGRYHSDPALALREAVETAIADFPKELEEEEF